MPRNLTYVFAGDTVVGEGITASLSRSGFPAAPSVESAGVVYTYHPTQSGLEDLYFGEDGLVTRVAPGTIFVDLSPNTPSFADELYQLASVHECNTVEAPLVVRDATVEDAFATPSNLLILAGGEHEAYDAVSEQLSAMATKVEFVGGTGAAQTAKVVHTIQNANALLGIVEGLASVKASQAEFDAEAYLDLLQDSGLATPTQVAFVEAMLAQDYEGTYTVGLMMAEIAVALTAVEDKEMVLPLTDATFHMFELLAVVGGQNFSPAALGLLFADQETSNAAGLDWSRAEAHHDHDHEHAHGDDEECDCEDRDDPDYECSCGHDHGHRHAYEDAFDEDGAYNEFGGYGMPATDDYLIDEIDEWN